MSAGQHIIPALQHFCAISVFEYIIRPGDIMKRPLPLLLILGLMSSSVALHSQTNYMLPEPVTIEHNQVTVGVYPQVELISVIQTIGGYRSALGFLMAKDTSGYAAGVMARFSTYSDHPAVKMFDRLSLQPGMLNFSAPSNIMLLADESLTLRTDIEPDEFVYRRAGGIDSLKILLGMIRDFAIRAEFNDFFRSHINFYLEITGNTVESMGSRNYIFELERFYGRSQKSYNIVLVPLYGHVGFGNSLLHSDGDREIYNTMGPRLISEGKPVFGDEDYLKYMIRHEFSHPFINPMTEKYWASIRDFSSNYDSVPEAARQNMCGDWQECINEFVIRAVTTHLAFRESADAGAGAYAKESARGVCLLDELLEQIRRYESDRATYPTFDSFYPNILELFKEFH